jgi:hypothetical protein
MDNINTTQETLVFAPLRPEVSRRWPAKNLNLLVDVEIRVRIIPAFLPDPNNQGLILDNLHFYVGDTDVTDSFLSVLRSKLDSGDSAARRVQFQAAVQRVLPYWQVIGAGRIDVNVELAAAQVFLSANPLSGALPQFGIGAPGGGGIFGIWCFLYDNVNLDAVRLSEVLQHYNAGHGTNLALGDLSRSDFALSPGKSPFRGGTTGALAGSAGAVELSLNSVYHNTNDDDIAAIKQAIVAIKQDIVAIKAQLATINTSLQAIGTKVTSVKAMVLGIQSTLAPTGAVMTRISDAQGQVNNLITDLGQTQTALDSLKQQVAALIAHVGP